jgi:hypothetical protein
VPLDVPGDMVVDDPDIPPDEDWANAVPAISRMAAAVAVTVDARMGGSFGLSIVVRCGARDLNWCRVALFPPRAASLTGRFSGTAGGGRVGEPRNWSPRPLFSA